MTLSDLTPYLPHLSLSNAKLRLFVRNMIVGLAALVVVGGLGVGIACGIVLLSVGGHDWLAWGSIAAGAFWFLLGYALTETFV